MHGWANRVYTLPSFDLSIMTLPYFFLDVQSQQNDC